MNIFAIIGNLSLACVNIHAMGLKKYVAISVIETRYDAKDFNYMDHNNKAVYELDQ